MKAFYCVGTHWDREWYEPFQEFRMWLVELIDELLDLMEKDPEYKSFHLDGQAVMLDDYLAIRPENRERLLDLMRQKRLVAGPWYVLPDEWLISGESYVRNLMLGMRRCRELGVEPMDYAYTPDQFGHVAALPMIMAGFGLRAGIVWRGAQDENFPAQFVWVGPDGSRMVTHKLRDVGSYGPFDFAVRRLVNEAGVTDENIRRFFDPYIEAERGRAPLPLVLMLDAIDHQRPDPGMPHLLDRLRALYPDIEFVWTTLPEYAEAMLAGADGLVERTGELREPARDADRGGQYLIVHTISSRYPLKQRNDKCQALLEKWVEPNLLFQQMNGGAPIMRYLDLAWEYLIKNHPHDSICGCSLDQVHRDMLYRFDQSRMLGENVLHRAVAQLAGASAKPEDAVNIAVHNPLPFVRREILEIPVAFPHDWPNRYIDGLATSEPINKFNLVKKDGTRVPFQISGIERHATPLPFGADGRTNKRACEVYRVTVELELPPCGHVGVKVEPTTEGTRNFGTLRNGPLGAENDHIVFELAPDGTAQICSKHGGDDPPVFDLFLYEDTGDSGDGWTRGPLINDIAYRSPGTRVITAVDEDGPLRTVFRVEREFDLPAYMERGTYKRSAERRTTRVTDRIIVDKHAPYVRVKTMVENTCCDHRFRVLFSTPTETDRSFADTPFAVVERDIPAPAESARWQERVNPEKAFTSFFGVQDEDGGLCVLAPYGLHEYEVVDTPERTLALTLFRATRQTVGTTGEPDGQLLQPLEFEYLVFPFVGEFDALGAAHIVAMAQSGVLSHPTAELAGDVSYLETNGSAVMTALKSAADGNGGVIRFWNPTESPVEERLQLVRKIARAQLCNLNEVAGESLQVEDGNCVSVTVPAFGLCSVRFEWGE